MRPVDRVMVAETVERKTVEDYYKLCDYMLIEYDIEVLKVETTGTIFRRRFTFSYINHSNTNNAASLIIRKWEELHHD